MKDLQKRLNEIGGVTPTTKTNTMKDNKDTWRLLVDGEVMYEGDKDLLIVIADKYKRFEDNCTCDIVDLFKSIYVYIY